METQSSGRLRTVYRGSVLVAVSPIVVTAIRFGLAGWQPVEDAGRIAVRVRDVFSSHPPLFGLAAWTSVNAHVHYSFPGALLFYLLAVPVKVLGTQWGILLGMAAINTGFGVVSLWLIRRRLGEKAAMVACLIFGSLLWALGDTARIDPTQHTVGLIPLFALLVAAWSVADGDGPAILVLAVVGNYLVLNVLEYTVIAPIVGFWAVVCGFLAVRRRAVLRSPDWGAERRSYTRWFLGAITFTSAAWIPVLYDQFAGSGNLGKLFHAVISGEVAAGQPAQLKPTLVGAVGVVVSVTAVPPWWMRSIDALPPFNAFGAGASFLFRTAWGVALLATVSFAFVLSHRRGDRTMMLGLATGCVAWFACVLTMLRDPAGLGFAVSEYTRSLWPTSAFLWLVIACAYARPLVAAVAPRFPRIQLIGVASGFVATVVLAAGLMSFKTSGPIWDKYAIARQLRALTRSHFAGSGPVQVAVSAIPVQDYDPVVMLGLQDIGVPFRVDWSYSLQQLGAWRNVALYPAVNWVVVSQWPIAPRGASEIGRAYPPAHVGDAEFQQLDRKMELWARGVRNLHVTAAGLNADERAQVNRGLDAAIVASLQRHTLILDSPTFLNSLTAFRAPGGVPLISVPGLTPVELNQWIAEKIRRTQGTVYLYTKPLKTKNLR